RATMQPEEVRTFLDRVGILFSLIETAPFPVIAAVNGHALGGGLELALACDFRLAADDAQLGLTETSLGIIPGAGGTQRLTRIAGIATAKELILTAKKISGTVARDKGIVHEALPVTELLSRAKGLAAEIAANAPVAVAQAKFAVDRGFDTDLGTGLAIERKAYEVTLPTSDRVEALTAFKEKRRPVFKGE
ncbi:MAG: enoyl-CoA hydratase/isomerase family protein, partial [Spirochaetia bacterium]|nr:enoyl-CoA hydratase/isomerase family protein [Spirochaetia bacterium]